ncbi:bifunctional helix-turn-helix transcriptional regulator/GNAT family N-acetyltransferase [Ferrovibrio sp.]|uniref:bifunctional helix-turn-helix transcriptional regulator/GNAT family N-acetyltransferase n=1 Tax=Ferrovibrio sp. TaxID=1917215 RepID=UPI002611E214|nr:bifunctional helix-turn-helix transcriptional regulator/GNAT family N-acetyltransferase [Ferrovibrio sp.]
MAIKYALAPQVERMRQFNRFYTHKIGVLEDGKLYAPFSLAETRVLYELAHRDRVTASDLVRDLSLDAGYLSRLLARFAKQGLVTRKPTKEDARQSLLQLTAKGRRTMAPLEAASHRVLEPLLARLSPAERARLTGAMTTIETLLGDRPAAKAAYRLRDLQPGDLGWVVQAHGRLYAQEYGWDNSFEVLVADIAAGIMKDFDPACERVWIAEMDGEPVGSVFLVKKNKTVAKLRLLIIDPKARGLGVGKALVAECIGFARKAGYKKITLWTNSILTAARGIYEKAGFKLVASEKHRSFGVDLIGETWDLKL